MRCAAAVLMLVASVAYGAEGTGMERSFTLAHPLSAGANAWLEVQAGPLAPGQRIRVTTATGEIIGAIAPFGPAQRRHPGIYTLPVPAAAIQNGVLSVRVTVLEGNKPPRAPTAAEVQGLKLLPPEGSQ